MSPRRKEREPVTTAELVPAGSESDSAATGAVMVESEEQLEIIARPFVNALKELDRERGTTLSETFAQCVRMHNNNAQLRSNLMQMQVVLQEQFSTWVTVKRKLGNSIDELDIKDEEFNKKMHALLDLSQRTSRMVSEVSDAVRAISKEIRQTEFSDRFHFHVSIVQKFVDGMKAIVFRRLRQHPELTNAVLSDMRTLAKMFEG